MDAKTKELINGLRCKYAIGPITANGEPEFGWRDFSGPMEVNLPTSIMLSAAEKLEELSALVKPELPPGFNHCAYNRQTGEWLYINHANTWQLFPGPVSAEGEWKVKAANWLLAKAEEQEAGMKVYPEHAKAYPQWEQRARELRWYAAELSPVALEDQRAGELK